MNPQLLIADLFCGAGGAAWGIHLACEKAGIPHRIVGFDIKPFKRYPFEMVVQDALTVDLSHFDAVWASPPCQRWVDPNNGHDERGYPDLIAPLRPRMGGLPYVIENVDKAPLQNAVQLCGTMFGLPLIRHRRFESDNLLLVPPACFHSGTVSQGDYAAVYARGGKGPRRGRDVQGNKVRDAAPLKEGPDPWQAMGIGWMEWKELTQAIPPVYAEFVWSQLLKVLA